MLRTNYLKKLLFVLFLALSGNKAFAQAAAYAFSQSTGTYTPLSGATVLIDATAASFDDQTFAVALPLPFVFNGVTYTDVYVSANGYIAFGTDDPGNGTRSFLSTDYYDATFTNVINNGGVAGYAGDLWGNSSSTAAISWQNTGNITTFEWTNVGDYNGGNATTQSYNFQIQLNHATNTISTIYGSMSSPTSTSKQVGIRTSISDFSNRTTTTDWLNTTSGTSNSDEVTIDATVVPPSGLTFTWTAPTCLPPSTIAGSNVTTTNADITWVEPTPAPASGYEYEVRSSGAAGSGAVGLDASGTSPTGTTTTTVTTLNPATTYTIYMRGICGPGDSSTWIASGTFTTNCIAIAAPYTEGFNTSALPNCWGNANSISGTDITLFWQFNSNNGSPRATTNTRPIGTFAWVDASFPQTGVVTLTSPVLDLSALASPYLQFDWYKNNQDPTVPQANNNLLVEGYDGTTWVTLMNDTSNSASWRTVGMTLPASFAGVTNAQFRFSVDKTLSATFYDDVLLDSFSVDNTPSCLAPGTVTASNVTSSGADITWVASGSAGVGYEYEVRTSGAAGSGTTGLQSSGTTVFGTNTATISGLASLTSYVVYVRTDCGSGSFSNWASVSFTTSIDCATATPITACGTSQTFTVPAGTGVYDMSTATPPGPYSTQGIETLYSFTAPLTGTYTLNVTATNSQWVDYYFKDATGGCGANGFTFIDDFFSPGTSTGQTISFDLVAGTTYYILADPEGTAGATQTFDLICPATCGDPTLVTASNITTSGADISWTQAGAGTPAQWEISYGPAGTTAGSGTTVLVSANPSTITGLSQTTAYDVYVRAICGVGDTSVWSAVGSFTTLTSCFQPTAVTTSNITATSVDFSWTAPATPPANGYEYEVRTSGAAGSGATGLVNGTNVAAGTTMTTVGGLNSATGYKIYVRSICGAGDTSAWTSATNFATTCVPPTVTSTTGGSSCGTGPATLSATGTGNNLYWYANNTTDTVAGTGSPFTTPSISATTTYYVASVDTTAYTGLGNTQIPVSTGWSAERGIVVQATQNFVLNSAQFYSTVTGGTIAGTATLVDDATGTILTTTPFSFTGGAAAQWYTMNLNWNLTAGNTYRLLASFSSGSVSRIDAGADYTLPAFNDLGSLGTITSGYEFGSYTPTSYNYFHNIAATTVCASPRSAVVATVGGSTTTVNLGNDTTLCSGSSLTLDAGNAGATYLWSTGATTQTITVSTAGTYSVTVSSPGGCSGNDTIVVNTGTAPMVMLGNDTALCTGASLTLDAGNAGATYVWSTGATTQTISVSAAGTYSVAVTNGGCTGRDTIAVSNGQPVVNLGPDASICGSVTLDAGAGGTMYMWSTGAMTQTITVSTPGTYSVAVTNANGCTGNDTIVISPASPLGVALGNDTTICTGSSLTLNAGNAAPGTTYLWSNGATTQTITVSTAGTYSVTVTNAGGCMGMDTINVAVSPLPVVALGNDTTVCAGATLTLNAGAGASYLWSTGATTQTVGAATTTPGTTAYSVMVMNAAGCMGMDTINVTVSPLPVVNLGNDTAVCAGNSLTLNAGNPGASYLWSTGATTQTITVTAGTYSVTVTNGNGCMGMDAINVSTATPPMPMLGNDTTICDGSSLTLNAGAGASYMWSTGANTQSLVVATTGTYSVTVTSAAGCMGMDTINVTVSPLPVVNLGNDTMLCPGANLTLDAGNAGATYLWSTGATVQSIVVSTAGTYSVTVTNAAGCVGMDAINVMPGMMPVAGHIVMSGSSPTYTFSTVGSAPGPHAWNFGDNSALDTSAMPTHTYTANGTYTVKYYVASPCGVDSADTTFTITNVGVSTVTLDGEVTLAPNPASDRVLVRNTSAQAMKHITVLNAVGAVVRENTPQNGKEQSIDLSGLAAATYMVRIEFDGGAIVVRRLQITQ